MKIDPTERAVSRSTFTPAAFDLRKRNGLTGLVEFSSNDMHDAQLTKPHLWIKTHRELVKILLSKRIGCYQSDYRNPKE